MNLGLNLGLGSNIRGIRIQAIQSGMAYNSTDTIQLLPLGATNYEVTNLPAYCSLNAATGVITATGDSSWVGYDSFDIVITMNGTTTTKIDGLTLVSFYDEADFLGNTNNADNTVPTTIAIASGTIANTNTKFMCDVNGTNSFMQSYYVSYGNKSQVIVNSADGVERYNSLIDFETDNVALQPPLYIGNGINIFTSVTSGATSSRIRINMCDTTNHIVTPTIVPLSASHSVNVWSPILIQGVDTRVYSMASVDGDSALSSIQAFDYATLTTQLWSNLNTSDGGMSGLGADATHVYYSTDRYGDIGGCYSIEISTGTVTDLTTVEVGRFQVQQRKNGVGLYVNKSGTITWRYLYNGIMSADITDFNANPPWGADTEDVRQISYVTDRSPEPSSDNQTVLRPTASGNGAYWYRYDDANPFVKVDIGGVSGIATYPSELFRLAYMPSSNSLLTSHFQYNGYTKVDLTDNSTEHFYLNTPEPSPYSMTTKGDITAISGYFNAPLYEYDSTKVWDDTINATYNPNTALSKINPAYKGTIGAGLNLSKTYSATYDINGFYWAVGSKIRSGEGGGCVYYKNDVALGVSGMTTYEGRSVVTNNSVVAVASIVDASSSVISIIDLTTKTILREITPNVLLTTRAGELAIDDSYVYLMTANDLNTETRFYKYLIADGSLVKSTVYAYASNVGGYNDEGTATLQWADDGFLYTTLDGASVLSRIDKNSMLAHPVNNNSFGISTINGNYLYDIQTTNIRKLSNILGTKGFQRILGTQVFSHLEILNATGTGYTTTYTDGLALHQGINFFGTGSSGSKWTPSLRIWLDAVHTGTIQITFTITVNDNGGTNVMGIQDWGINGEAYVNERWGPVGVGTHVFTTSKTTAVGFERINMYFDGLNYNDYDFIVDNISVELT